MRPSRQFRPLGLIPLEDRVVLSNVSPVAPQPKPVKVDYSIPNPDNIVKANVGNFHGLTIAQTVQAGNPVYEEITTNFTNGTSQYESRLIVPNKATNTVTTTKAINLRNNQGYEKVVDVATTTGTDSTGTTIMHNITTTLPGGQVETETETELAEPSGKTLLKGTITLPGGSTETFTATVTTSGKKTTTDETLIDAEGFSTTTDTTVTMKSQLSQTTTTVTTYPDGTATTSISNTYDLRLLPPASLL